MARRRLLALVLAAALGAAGVATTVPEAEAYPGAPWFRPSRTYAANFPDPAVIEVDGTYYAYATTTGGAYLPVMRYRGSPANNFADGSWLAREAYVPPAAPAGYPCGTSSDPYFNDALPYPARWGIVRPGASCAQGRLVKDVMAPGVAKIGSRFVLFYAIRVAPTHAGINRYCISVAVSSSPTGPFSDRSSRPLVCDRDPGGSIDPFPFVDSNGVVSLLWKSEGVPTGVAGMAPAPTRIFIRRLTSTGIAFAEGSTTKTLLVGPQQPGTWEGLVIENPSMVRYNGAYYLFYSANEWRSSAYAVGVARCTTARGPCRRHSGNPVLRSRGTHLGPGAPAPIVVANRIVLGHHWWNAPYTDYPAYPACLSQVPDCEHRGQRRLGFVAVGDAALP